MVFDKRKTLNGSFQIMRFLPTTFLLIVCSLFPIATKPEKLQNQTDFDNGDGMNHSQSSPCPSSATDGLDEISEWCKFWLQGILLTLIGLCGIVGNLVSLFCVLSAMYLYYPNPRDFILIRLYLLYNGLQFTPGNYVLCVRFHHRGRRSVCLL